MKPMFMLMKQIDPPTLRPWRIAETTQTSDGPRTRMCDGTWETEADAKTSLDKRKDRQMTIAEGFSKHVTRDQK